MRKKGKKAWVWLVGALLASSLNLGCASVQTGGAAKEEVTTPPAVVVATNVCDKSAVPVKHWPDDKVIVKFNDSVITFADIKKRYHRVAKDPAKDLSSYQYKVIGDFIVNQGRETLFAKEAVLRDIESTDIYKEAYRRWLVDELPKVWVDKEITEKVTMTDEEILAWAAPALPDVKLRVLVKSSQVEAQKLYDEIMSGKDMGELIKAQSEGLSSSKGGLTDFINVNNSGNFPPPVVQRFLDMKVGEITKPFYQDIGYLVVRVEEKRSAEELRKAWLESVRAEYILKRRQEVYREKVDELVRKSGIKANAEVLDRLGKGEPDVEKELLLELGEFKYTAAEVLGTSLYGQHGDDTFVAKVNKFMDKMVITQDALRLKHDTDPIFLSGYNSDKQQLLSQSLIDKVGKDALSLEVTDQLIEEFMKANVEEFSAPDTYSLSLMQLDKESDIEIVYAKLKEGTSFADLAKAMSTHKESADGGGKLADLLSTSLPEPVLEAVKEVAEGEVTKAPVKVKLVDGSTSWLVLKVEGVRKGAPLGLDSVNKPMLAGRIKTNLRTNALMELMKTSSERFGYDLCIPQQEGKEN